MWLYVESICIWPRFRLQRGGELFSLFISLSTLRMVGNRVLHRASHWLMYKLVYTAYFVVVLDGVLDVGGGVFVL